MWIPCSSHYNKVITMTAIWLLAVLVGSTLAAHPTTAKPKSDHDRLVDLEHQFTDLKHEKDFMEKSLEDLTRQVMLQQLFVEERIRSDGNSGLKKVRNVRDSTTPYYLTSVGAQGIAGLHEHANNDRTVGMGELNVVLNGVEFRTRHNDYRLRMPSTTTKNYNEMQNIPCPAVPPAVLHKKTVHEQILEMREWFKAFRDQDHSKRDYRPYFRPVLTYLEGGWTTNTKTLEEPFFSDRHHIDASSWFDLQEKVRYTSAAGSKDALENYAYLPTTIMNVNNGVPEYAQWNYRVLAHPIKGDLPLRFLGQVDDLVFRMRSKKNMSELASTRAARFKVWPRDRLNRESAYAWGKLDELMYEIPGKDNYKGHIVRDDEQVFLTSTYAHHVSLDVSRYHRWYKSNRKDAMGQTRIHRGFSDSTMFVAETTNTNIAPSYHKKCDSHREHGHTVQNCTSIARRFTYAIPLEIVYLTPLLSWNPYNLHHIDSRNKNAIKPVVTGPHGMRTGGFTKDTAYNGTYPRSYYRTPKEFYSSTKGVDADRADTAKGVVGVLDTHGNVRNVTASGNRIIIPAIEGVGRIRTRYPIVPLHSEGEQTREELDALKHMVMHMPTYSKLFEETPTGIAKATQIFMESEHTLKVSPTTQSPPGLHDHDIIIHQYDIEDLKKGHKVTGLLTSVDNGHMHSIDVQLKNGEYIMASCDGMPRCWDGHDIHLTYEA